MINPVLRVICQFYAKNLGWNILSSFDPNIFYCTHKDLMIIKIYYQKQLKSNLYFARWFFCI